jgi:hypothetical protein
MPLMHVVFVLRLLPVLHRACRLSDVVEDQDLGVSEEIRARMVTAEWIVLGTGRDVAGTGTKIKRSG